MKILIPVLLLCFSTRLNGQSPLTPFEKSGGKETATFPECISFYKQLDKASPKISIKEMGMSDAGFPYHLVLFSNDGKFDPSKWHAQKKIVLLVINAIHPGEPDGVDASMMLVRDLSTGKIKMPDNLALAVIPVYNIGGALNRNKYSRVNQNGPESYGFRGNAQNLDLNRDFTKCDSRDARSFTEIFHWLNPDVQLDNHVSDGADYQHTMTLISTQWNKLGGKTGKLLHGRFDPRLFSQMDGIGWSICPYVNLDGGDPQKGWEAFLDFPRYSSGYAAMFHVLSFISETHMLKPFSDRALSTYALMQALIKTSSEQGKQIIESRKADIEDDLKKNEFPLRWICDTTKSDTILFKGYTAAKKISSLTGQARLYYDHTRPFQLWIPYYDYFDSARTIRAPKAYLIPQGWHEVIDLLKLNGVRMQRLSRDSVIKVQAYHIDDYKTLPKAYEKHHKNFDVRVSSSLQTIAFLKGDYIIPVDQDKKRFILEMLEPTGDDSYFAWNFFDAILQQKEWYSDYRWEDVAEAWVKEHPELKNELEAKKKTELSFAGDAGAQMEFIYRRSPYYEPEHLRYPVYRITAASQRN